VNINDHAYTEPRHIGYHVAGFDPEWAAEASRHRPFVVAEVSGGPYLVDHSVDEYLDTIPGAATRIGFAHVGARRPWMHADDDGDAQACHYLDQCRRLNHETRCDFGPILDMTGDPVNATATPGFIIGWRRKAEAHFGHLTNQRRTAVVKLTAEQVAQLPATINWSELPAPYLWIEADAYPGEDVNLSSMRPTWPLDPEMVFPQFATSRPVLWQFTRRAIPLDVREHPEPRLRAVCPVGAEAAWRYAGADEPPPPAPVNAEPRFYSETVKDAAVAAGLDPASIVGTGKDGRILKSDVDAAIKASDPDEW